MKHHAPRVSIGLPVYNGEKYLAAAIDSLLAQTFTDFELIISDNASTDNTAQICSKYAAQDSRIRYFRAEINRGAPWNFNQAFQYARGEYFKWHAADDVCAPTLLEKSVAMLDGDASIVLCYPRTAVIDNQGSILPDAPGSWCAPAVVDSTSADGMHGDASATDADKRGLDSSQPHNRLRGILMDTVWCYELFGLARREAISRTHLQRLSSASGKAYLIEMAFQGRIVELPEVLFINRRHAEQYTMLKSAAEQRHFDQPDNKKSGSKLPHQIPCTFTYAKIVFRGPLSVWERMRCFGVLVRYVFQVGKWKRIWRSTWRGFGMWDGSLTVPAAENRLDSPQPASMNTR